MPSALRSLSLGLAAIGIALLSPILSDGHAVAAPTLTPTHNTAPGRHFRAVCSRVSTAKSAQDRCDAAAVKAFNKVRAGEGVGPLTLPSGFDTMPAAEQLLVISNLERTDRGLRPVTARVTQLDSLASYGAHHNEDPPFPSSLPSGAAASSLWAGAGTSALLDDFYWMYDDGPGSGNIDCHSAGDPGCWGHRRGILNPFSAPLYMGAASAPSSYFGASIAEEFVGGGHSESSTYTPTGLTWAQLTSRLPVGVGRARVAVASDVGVLRSGRLHLWASGTRMTVHVGVTSGRPSWSVNPASCTMAAGHGCTVSIGYRPTSTASLGGTLSITGPNGTRTVRLAGHQAAPTVSLTPSSRTVARHQHATLHVLVATSYSRHRQAGVTVELQRRKPGSSRWHLVRRRRSGPHGGAEFGPRPTRTTDYRVIALPGGGFPAATSRVVTVTVA